jgi:PAS domain S-box-containing protein
VRREVARLNLDSEAVLEAAFEHGYSAMVITDADFDGGPFIQRCNPAFCAMTGYTEQELVGQSPRILQGPDTDRNAIDQLKHAIRTGEFFEGSAVNYRKNGVAFVVQWNISPVRDADGAIVAYISIQQDITARVVAEREAEEARRQQARTDERYRRSMDNAAVGMCLIAPDGRFVEVNDALCGLFGYDAETLKQRTWQELTAPDHLEADLQNVNDVLYGRIDSYRMTKKYIHADGHLIWGDLAVSCVRDEDGKVENFISQITDITKQVEATERNRILAERLKQQSDRMTQELESAAAYMSSIMPTGLTGKVAAASRYLPSRELGGDCFDYTWIDDDHLLVYLIDVSGHGIEPALLSVSVHNMIRSGSLKNRTLRDPGSVLNELNRLFQMDRHSGHYFTMWCGVYEASSRTLRYACGGAPPALAFESVNGEAPAMTELSSRSLPVGMFEDTVYAPATCSVSPGFRLLIYSDGACELEPADGRRFALDDFKNLATRLARAPKGSIDELVEELRARTPAGGFEDDCSLIGLRFT